MQMIKFKYSQSFVQYIPSIYKKKKVKIENKYDINILITDLFRSHFIKLNISYKIIYFIIK